MVCPFRTEEYVSQQYEGRVLIDQRFKDCLKGRCPAYKYEEVADGWFKDICLRLRGGVDKW